MTYLERAALRALAEAATPGPWIHWAGTHLVIRKHSGAKQAEDLRICEVSLHTRNDESRHNTAFIAAANPAAILALLDEIVALQSRLDIWNSRFPYGVKP